MCRDEKRKVKMSALGSKGGRRTHRKLSEAADRKGHARHLL